MILYCCCSLSMEEVRELTDVEERFLSTQRALEEQPDHIRIRGEERPSARLTEEEVFYIFVNSDKLTRKARALKYGVSVATISAIDRGATWNHVTGLPLAASIVEKYARMRKKTQERKRRQKATHPYNLYCDL